MSIALLAPQTQPARILVACPNCRVQFKVKSELMGRTAKCSRCQNPFSLVSVPIPARPIPQQKTVRLTETEAKQIAGLYSPLQIAAAVFLGGPMAGGTLVGLNHRRMGQPLFIIASLAVSFMVNLAVLIASAMFMTATKSFEAGVIAFLGLNLCVIGLYALYTSEVWKKQRAIKVPEQMKQSGRMFLVALSAVIGWKVGMYIFGQLMVMFLSSLVV